MTAALPGPSEPPGWAEWEAVLTDAVLRLADAETLTLAAPGEHARMARTPGTARLRWLLGGRRRPVVPSVRLVRVEDHLRGHWVGAERFGGWFPWTREEEEAILAAGWHRPTAGDGDDFVRFWPDDVPRGPYLPRDDARRAASAVAATFRGVLGADPDGGLPQLRAG